MTFSNESRTTDLFPDFNPEHRDSFIATKSHHGCQNYCPQMLNRLWRREPGKGFVPNNQPADEDCQDDGNSCHIFHSSVPIRESVRWYLAHSEKGNPQRNGDCGISEVMDGICTGCGSEVDVVLEQADGWVAGVEVKTSATVTASDFAALQALRDFLGKRFRAGIVLYGGDHAVPFGEKLWLVPIHLLWAP